MKTKNKMFITAIVLALPIYMLGLVITNSVALTIFPTCLYSILIMEFLFKGQKK